MSGPSSFRRAPRFICGLGATHPTDCDSSLCRERRACHSPLYDDGTAYDHADEQGTPSPLERAAAIVRRLFCAHEWTLIRAGQASDRYSCDRCGASRLCFDKTFARIREARR